MDWWMDMMVYVKGSIFMSVWIWMLFSKRGYFGSAMVAAVVLGAYKMKSTAIYKGMWSSSILL